jgi:hypothetical protein
MGGMKDCKEFRERDIRAIGAIEGIRDIRDIRVVKAGRVVEVIRDTEVFRAIRERVAADLDIRAFKAGRDGRDGKADRDARAFKDGRAGRAFKVHPDELFELKIPTTPLVLCICVRSCRTSVSMMERWPIFRLVTEFMPIFSRKTTCQRCVMVAFLDVL